MEITVNNQDMNIDVKSDVLTIAGLLKYLEIDFRVIVEKNGELAEKTDGIAEGDIIRILRFAAGG